MLCLPSLGGVPHVELAGPPNLRHQHLRSALQFAVAVAEAEQRRNPPLSVPPELKVFFRQPRLPLTTLGRIRRIVEGAAEFRGRVAVAATTDAVDDIGLEWLRREAGWEARVSDLIEDRDRLAAEADAARQLAREQRRRAAAEEAAERARRDAASLAARLAEQDRKARPSVGERVHEGDLQRLRSELSAARQEARHARDRAEADRLRLAEARTSQERAERRAAAAERQRDDLLVARAELPGGEGGRFHVAELRALAATARALAEGLGRAVAEPPPRRPVELTGEARKDPRRAAEQLLVVPGIVALVDGYNVAKLTWPQLDLDEQRQRTLDAVDGLARRYGTELVVVFDGADVVGANANVRRLARVRFSPPGVTADDVIRGEVAELDVGRPVLVVTNDAAIRRDVIAAGANVVGSATLIDVALR